MTVQSPLYFTLQWLFCQFVHFSYIERHLHVCLDLTFRVGGRILATASLSLLLLSWKLSKVLMRVTTFLNLICVQILHILLKLLKTASWHNLEEVRLEFLDIPMAPQTLQQKDFVSMTRPNVSGTLAVFKWLKTETFFYTAIFVWWSFQSFFFSFFFILKNNKYVEQYKNTLDHQQPEWKKETKRKIKQLNKN